MSIEVVIPNSDPHSRLHHSIIAESNAALDSFLPKSSAMLAHEQQAGRGVLSDIKIGPTIAIKISRDGGHGISRPSAPYSTIQSNLTKRSIALIVVEVI